jgi:hypothetical protein
MIDDAGPKEAVWAFIGLDERLAAEIVDLGE